ncbi:hypothetical protein ACHAXT_012189 [Thalassiosira profunda]
MASPTAASYSTSTDADNFSRYSKFLVKNSNGVDGMGGQSTDGGGSKKEQIKWVDTLGEESYLGYQSAGIDHSSASPGAPRPFSILSWNVLAQSLYESQYQRRRIQQVALSTSTQEPQLPPSLSTSSPHPHPWPKRMKRMIEILSHANSDVVCLQECELISFKEDLAPALSKLGYDGIAQEDDRPDVPVGTHEATKHKYPRNHIVATFWKRDKVEPVGEASVRTRSLTTVLRLKATGATPTVAVVNVHLEGHPRRFAERTHQLQHSMSDIAKRIEREKEELLQSEEGLSDPSGHIGKLNALVIAGDFNCELQSSACSAYLRMGRLGRQAGLGGVHGEDSLALPPTLLGTTEATEVIHPVLEWGRALPEEELSNVDPHPFRRNGMTSAYPAWLGRDDARSHFTFCSELSKRPVPGLDQLWFSSMTLERIGLRRMFVDDIGLWERYFYDASEVEKRREHERRKVLLSGLPSTNCNYPSDHLPIGAIFDWKWDKCGDSCLLGDNEDASQPSSNCIDGRALRGLNIIDSEGNDAQDDALQDQLLQQKKEEHKSFENPHDELAHLLRSCPYDSEQQESDVRYILSPLDPPIPLAPKVRVKPTPEQLEQIEARRVRKAEVLTTASLGVRPWLKRLWKASKKAGKWDRQKLIQEARLAEK